MPTQLAAEFACLLALLQRGCTPAKPDKPNLLDQYHHTNTDVACALVHKLDPDQHSLLATVALSSLREC